jgi:hypothetical protein
MANSLTPFGFQLAGFLDGRTGSLGQSQWQIQSGLTYNIYSGDPVTLTSGYVVNAGTSDVILGVFIGCEYYSSAVNRKVWSPYWPASTTVPTGTTIDAWVITDPQATFRVQTNATSALAQSVLNASYTFGGNGTTGAAPTSQALNGQSVAYLDIVAGAGSTKQFRVISFVTAPPGANGTDTTSAYQTVIVGFNNQTYRVNA